MNVCSVDALRSARRVSGFTAEAAFGRGAGFAGCKIDAHKIDVQWVTSIYQKVKTNPANTASVNLNKPPKVGFGVGIFIPLQLQTPDNPTYTVSQRPAQTLLRNNRPLTEPDIDWSATSFEDSGKKRLSVNFKMTHRACLKVGLVRFFL